MIEDPEIRARVLEWQKRYNIRDEDPAMALIDLINIYYRNTPGANPASVVQPVSSIDPEELKQILSAVERLTFQTQELKEMVSKVQLNELVEQIRGYHEGIEYATKKMALVVKESDELLARLTKVASQINPVARGAVLALMIVSGLAGWLVAVLLR